MKLFRKIITAFKNFNLNILIILGLLLHLQISPILAQTESPWYDPTPEQHFAALEQCREGNVGLECTVQAIVAAIENALGEHAGPTQTIEESGGTSINYNNGGATQFATNLIFTLLSTPPIYTSDYTDYLALKINPASPAYAQQGTGFRALSGLIQIWTTFRNMAYLAFVLIFIAIGFLIMFRAQINPQTVVNIQNSLPKLVITLLLITFSYAIASFMVDLIYVGIYLAVSVMATQGLIANPDEVRQIILEENIFQMAADAGFFRKADTVGRAILNILDSAVGDTWFAIIYGALPFKSGLATIIIKIAVLFSLFKVFFQLVMSYINIIISTLLSPIMILFNALPGSTSFSNWIRNFLSNIIIFPALALLFLISAILIGRSDADDRWQVQTDLFVEGEPWTPPFVATESTPDDISAIIALGFVLFAPNMITLIQQGLKSKPLPVAGVFAPIAAGYRIATAPGRAAISGGTSMAKTYIGQKIEGIAGEARK